jgi:hypothetical protein
MSFSDVCIKIRTKNKNKKKNRNRRGRKQKRENSLGRYDFREISREIVFTFAENFS